MPGRREGLRSARFPGGHRRWEHHPLGRSRRLEDAEHVPPAVRPSGLATAAATCACSPRGSAWGRRSRCPSSVVARGCRRRWMVPASPAAWTGPAPWLRQLAVLTRLHALQLHQAPGEQGKHEDDREQGDTQPAAGSPRGGQAAGGPGPRRAGAPGRLATRAEGARRQPPPPGGRRSGGHRGAGRRRGGPGPGCSAAGPGLRRPGGRGPRPSRRPACGRAFGGVTACTRER